MMKMFSLVFAMATLSILSPASAQDGATNKLQANNPQQNYTRTEFSMLLKEIFGEPTIAPEEINKCTGSQNCCCTGTGSLPSCQSSSACAELGGTCTSGSSDDC